MKFREQGLLGGLGGDGAACQSVKVKECWPLEREVAEGVRSQEERIGGVSWALNVCTTQGTRARTRHGQRVYLRKLKM
jgi:hypothetical protein